MEDMKAWWLRRHSEANGFISRRIVSRVSGFYQILYGSSFVWICDSGIIHRVIPPEDIIFEKNKLIIKGL